MIDRSPRHRPAHRRIAHAASACSALALATAISAGMAAPAMAQSFQGEPQVAFGSATVTSGNGTTNVTVNTPSAVIDWSTFDSSIANGAPINFQPAGTTATFTNNPQSTQNFALLNRIIPADTSRPIQFNGNVISRLQTAAGQVSGGTVFFYSPGGIVVGSSAVFDVGNLGLTSAAPLVDANGNWYAGNRVQFQQAATGTPVEIRQGAQITASAQGSYVAAFAPRISQQGTISVNGQAALVAGGAGTIRFSPDGLFDIAVEIGADQTFAFEHTGTTTGPASSGAGDNHRIYMVVAPKNDLIQMAISNGSRIGFDVAGAADKVGNAVILSAGYDIAGGAIAGRSGTGRDIDLVINDSQFSLGGAGIAFTSAVKAQATGTATVDIFGQTSFASDLDIAGSRAARVFANTAGTRTPGTLAIGGNLTVSTGFETTPGTIDAGDVTIGAFNGGAILVTGNASALARASRDLDGNGIVRGGNANVSINSNGRLIVGGTLVAASDAQLVLATPTQIITEVRGGNSAINVNDGRLAVTGETRIGSGAFSATGSAANAFAGSANISASQNGNVALNALGVSASALAYRGGAATGGTATANVNSSANLAVGDVAFFSADGTGGDATAAGAGGSGTGGRVGVFASTSAAASFAGRVEINATGRGGRSVDGVAGTGTGGYGSFNAISAAQLRQTSADAGVTVSAFGIGGDATGAGTGGEGRAGRSELFAGGGTIAVQGPLTVSGVAFGGAGVKGGDATSSLVSEPSAGLFANNGSISVVGTTQLFGQARGGDGRAGGNGGNATGGFAVIDATSSAAGPSAITLSNLTVSSSATGGAGGAGTGSGGAGGAGGSATGGAVQAFGNAGNGTLQVTGTTTFSSSAVGGAGGAGANNSAGTGGNGGAGGAASSAYIQFGTRSGLDTQQNAGSATFANVSVNANAVGGAGGAGGSGTTAAGNGGNGGEGISRGAVLLVRGSPVTAGTVSMQGNGTGGNGGTGARAGAGGFGQAGALSLVATQRFQSTERGSANLGDVTMTAIGRGGTGSTPGASYYAANGEIVATQSDLNIRSLSLAIQGSAAPIYEVTGFVVDPVTGQQVQQTVLTQAFPIDVRLADSTVTIANTLSVSTPGEITVSLDNATLNAGGAVTLDARNFVAPATAPASVGTINSSGAITVRAANGSALLGGANLVGRTGIAVTASENVRTGNLASQGEVRVTATNGSITTGTITAPTVDLRAATTLATGVLSATNLNLSTGQALNIASLTGTNFSGSSASANFGSITLSGNLTFATTGDFTAGTVRAGDAIAIDAVGRIAVDGAWTSSRMTLSSGDIAIGSGGTLTAGNVALVSRNAGGVFVGENAGGSGGYRLDNSEFGRIASNNIAITTADTAGDVDIAIGNLSVDGARFGSGTAAVTFAVTGSGSAALSRAIQVRGTIAGSNIADGFKLGFNSGLFELNTETGRIALSGSGPGGLGGTVAINADYIHIASPEILAKLRADAFYAGRAADLDRPATVSRPEGVLVARGLQLFPTRTLYIQNTGTQASPAGFLTTVESSDIEPPGFRDPGAPDVDAVINGRFVGATGEVTGRSVFGQIVTNAESRAGFTATSQVNGCAFAGAACGDSGPASSSTIASEFAQLQNDTLEEQPFENEDAEDEESAEEAASAPIAPPAILISTTSLERPVEVVDPVSGSGNPALIDTARDEFPSGGE